MRSSKVVRSQSSTPPVNEKFLAELSARSGVPTGPLKLAVETARKLPAESVTGISRWVDALAGLEARKRQKWVVSIAEALETLVQNNEDPLDAVDEPMSLADKIRAQVQADQGVETSRTMVLSESLSAEEAAEKSGRSRQNLEAMRRKGQALALRVGQQWRYPAYQFDQDAVGGILPGIREVLASRSMSPAGVALWLILPAPVLKDARPIDLLRQGRTREVVQAAEELGYAP
jgi:hypothetical protein